ncbi:MAG: VWA domain-containing protein [Candidatus Riflebacteria bacterium]|nr:VWA domain-containing protein [Candidatus Riflebacteria bacterium]
MTFLQPGWLILFLPILAFSIGFRFPSKKLGYLKFASLAMLVIAAADPVFYLPQPSGMIIVLVDRSRSMPPEHTTVAKEIIDILEKNMGANNKLGVVSFGENAIIEKFPGEGKFSGTFQNIQGDASNLGKAVSLSLSIIPQNVPARMLLLSDGIWTGKSPIPEFFKAAARNIPIDLRVLERPNLEDRAIESFEAPALVSPGEGFLINSWVRSPAEEEIGYKLTRNGDLIAKGIQKLTPGLNRLAFRDIFENSDSTKAFLYRLEIDTAKNDPFPENNQAKCLVTLKGTKPILLISGNPFSSLGKALENCGLKVKKNKPESFSWTIEELSMFSGVILEDIPAEKLGFSGISLLPLWVTQLGGGLMMTGGKNSFGQGGYYKSQIEPILPVSLELRNEQRKFSVAIVIAMDRSGSMAIEAGNGRKKMDLANIAAAEVVNILGPTDEIGIIAVDSIPHIITPLGPINNKTEIQNNIMSIQAEGGGIFIGEALNAAVKEIESAKAETKHIILFADASDSEEPGKYKEIVNFCNRKGISISVVGMGMPGDRDSDLLREIASRGKGQIFFTENLEDLPRIFVQDTFIIAKSSFVESKVPVQVEPGLQSLLGQVKPPWLFPPIGGYNLTYLRPGAFQALKGLDESSPPILAFWQAGMGRTLCYTGEIDGLSSGGFARWENAPDFISSLARWTSGETGQANQVETAFTEIRNGYLFVRLNLDPERWKEDYSEPPEVSLIRSEFGKKPSTEKLRMTWESANSLVAEVNLHDREVVVGCIDLRNGKKLSIPPVCLPFSPEYQSFNSSKAEFNRGKILKITSGKEKVELSSIWKDLKETPAPIPVVIFFLSLSIFLFLLEIVERRTKVLSIAFSKFPGTKLQQTVPQNTSVLKTVERIAINEENFQETQVKNHEKIKEIDREKDEKTDEKQKGLINALKKAQIRGNKRNE